MLQPRRAALRLPDRQVGRASRLSAAGRAPRPRPGLPATAGPGRGAEAARHPLRPDPQPRPARRHAGYESAAEVCAALGDYLGDTLSTGRGRRHRGDRLPRPRRPARAGEPAGTLRAARRASVRGATRRRPADTQPGSVPAVDAETRRTPSADRPRRPRTSGPGRAAGRGRRDARCAASRPATAGAAGARRALGTRPARHRPPGADRHRGRPGSTWVRLAVVLGGPRPRPAGRAPRLPGSAASDDPGDGTAARTTAAPRGPAAPRRS